MSDLEKCKDSLCPSKESCLRYTKIDSVINVIANFNREEDADNCNLYLNNGLTNLKTNKIMNQTAVEYLIEQIKKDSNLRLRGFDIDGIGNQAKEIEKQQIMESYKDRTCQFSVDSRIDCPKSAEQYYNQKFNNKIMKKIAKIDYSVDLTTQEYKNSLQRLVIDKCKSQINTNFLYFSKHGYLGFTKKLTKLEVQLLEVKLIWKRKKVKKRT
jgi:hypothetical protein